MSHDPISKDDVPEPELTDAEKIAAAEAEHGLSAREAVELDARAGLTTEELGAQARAAAAGVDPLTGQNTAAEPPIVEGEIPASPSGAIAEARLANLGYQTALGRLVEASQGIASLDPGMLDDVEAYLGKLIARAKLDPDIPAERLDALDVQVDLVKAARKHMQRLKEINERAAARARLRG